MRKIKELWKKARQKYKKFCTLLERSWWYFLYYHTRLDDRLVFIESRDGKDFTGNMFRIAQELSKKEYRDLKLCVWIRRETLPAFQALRKTYGLKRMRLVHTTSQAIPVMERAKYIVSDSGVPWEYVKREGQVVLNTWHGTPLKVMGRRVNGEKHLLGTVQHFFFSSDYLLYPSEYMRDTMLRDYMVENVISGKALMSGYPRNSVFFDAARGQEVKARLGLADKRVYAYMPTYRGNMKRADNARQVDEIVDHLSYLDAYMAPDQVLLVKLHVFNQSQIDFSQFIHIKPFPKGYETYDALNAADCLITDYSSVFFDYANSRKKIILFAYDEEAYFADRGTYFPFSELPFSELPFPCVKTPQSLLEEMNAPKTYDDQAFLEKFCTYDSPDAAQKLCRHVFRGEPVCRETPLGDGKENVLVFAGCLAKNGITTAFVNLMNNVDRTKRNYFASFNRWEVNGDPGRVDVIPPHIGYFPLMCDTLYTLGERFCYKRYLKNRNPDAKYPRRLARMYRRELDRYYWGAKFSRIIQFDGYGSGATLLFMESPVPKAIFVHNDMVSELKTKSFQHPATVKETYTHYDMVAVVSSDLIEPTMQVGAPREKIILVDNIHDAQSVRERAKLPITFEKDTECRTSNPGGIKAVLNSTGKKFITIGRFSPEKGHQRLLKAFDAFCDDYPDTQLIIIGGYGYLYNNTVRYSNGLKHWKNVTIIRSIQNPMPILRQCDLFILPSLYEGLGLVILEADSLGVPAFATDIVGPKKLMEEYRGHLVEDSDAGILKGMYDFMKGSIKKLNIDYEAYKRQALQKFEALFEE